MTTIDQEYARLKTLADAATPGPWFSHNGDYVWTTDLKHCITCNGPDGICLTATDCHFMAEAHDMMALIERLMAERKLAHSALEAQRRFRHDLSACGCQGCMDTRALLGVAPVADAGPTPFAGRRTDRTRE